MLSKGAASECENKPALELPNASADRFMRGAHHRRCAREGLTGAYDALCRRLVATWATRHTPGRPIQTLCGILRSAFFQFFKTTLDIGICALASLCRLFV